MKNTLGWLAMNCGFAAAVWFGFVEGVEGAQYMAKFFVLAVAVPLGLILLTDAMQKKIADDPEPPKPVRRTVQRLIAWLALGVFVWYGHIATAVAWGFWMLAAAIFREGVKKLRAGPSAVPDKRGAEGDSA